MADRKFSRAERGKYSLEEKEALGKLCEKYKLEFDEKVKSTSKQVNYNEKRKKHTNQTPRDGYVAKAVREFFEDLKTLSIMIGILKQQLNSEKDVISRLLRAKVKLLLINRRNPNTVELVVDERKLFLV